MNYTLIPVFVRPPADNKITAGRAGAIEAVVAGMQRHVDVAGVQEQGAWAIKNMTINGNRLGPSAVFATRLLRCQIHPLFFLVVTRRKRGGWHQNTYDTAIWETVITLL